ncbi:SPFH domain-containing protein [Lacticaseibacillus kribbianus]|uniref:SPFH domain-containing protein n=1 Tax=Lacticaseibacillus kribbianus TaxID=2926292 RepID=UPI001CD25C28|nr:SPFH domain-containing protein [Lacticaseibacillus kribbianus]
MGIFKGLTDSISSTLGDQWKDIIVAGNFEEQTAVVAGHHQDTNGGHGANTQGSAGVISNGSIIRVPENVAAFIFSQAGITQIITDAGEYVVENGEASVFAGERLTDALLKTSMNRLGFGGQSDKEMHVAFVNLREIRGLKFGTPAPLAYNDHYYGADLEVVARGSYAIKITDPELFVRNFLPANTTYYSFADVTTRAQINPEFLQSFTVSLASLSAQYRISDLPAKGSAITQAILNDPQNTGTWPARFGFTLTSIALEAISFSDESRALVKLFSTKKMETTAYNDTSQRASNIAAQQKIASGIETNGFGDGAGMLMGMNVAQGLNPGTAQPLASTPQLSIDEQIETVRKLKSLLDAGALTQDEFDQKKKEILGL